MATKSISKGSGLNLRHRLAMSKKGLHTFGMAVLWQLLNNFALISPFMLVYFLIESLFPKGILVESNLTERLLWTLLFFAIAMLVLMFLFGYTSYMKTYTAVYKESANMRTSLAEHLRRLPLSFYDRRNSSDLTSTIMDDVSFLETMYTHILPQFAGALFMLILMCIGLSIYDWRLAIALLWVVPVSVFLLYLTRHWQYKGNKKDEIVNLAVKEKIDEGLQQVQTILANRQEKRYMRELNQMLALQEKSHFAMELNASVLVNLIVCVVRLGIPTMLIVGASLFLSGQLSFDILLFFFLLSAVIYQPLYDVLINASILMYTGLRVDRMNEIYDTPIQEGEKDFTPKNFDIEFKEVSFAYKEEEAILHKVSFVAKQGETTALIGPSGGGKSTCARLAARFWDAPSGEVLLGGVNVTTIEPETLLKYYAIVFQDVVLFNTSVMENIRIGRKDATDEEVLLAAQKAQCDSFVKDLPEGYQTNIGENGSRLSGGERQRISIARAILKDAPIIILDEATASQDVENESEIQRALSSLIKDKTVLIIAHRMRTIAFANKIIAIENGKVIESGTPEALYANEKGLYRKMLNCQQIESSNL